MRLDTPEDYKAFAAAFQKTDAWKEIHQRIYVEAYKSGRDMTAAAIVDQLPELIEGSEDDLLSMFDAIAGEWSDGDQTPIAPHEAALALRRVIAIFKRNRRQHRTEVQALFTAMLENLKNTDPLKPT